LNRRTIARKINEATEYLTRHILDSKIVYTCMTSIVKLAEESDDDSRHIVANILLREDHEEILAKMRAAAASAIEVKKNGTFLLYFLLSKDKV